MQIALLGLGLIGGSVARAVQAREPGWRLVAWSSSGHGPAQALAAGVIDRAADDPAGALWDADLVVVAAPPLAALELLTRLAPMAAELHARGATVTDVVSTKVQVARAAADARLPFVGGHPMAGRDVTGFAASSADLFEGRPWVVTEPVGGGDPARVEALARACGASPIRMDAGEHDELVAAISHLPLLTSVALVEAVAGRDGAIPPDWPAAARLAASGWRDTTRLARGDATMGAGIAATNAAPIARRLRRYRDVVDEWIALLEAPGADAATIEARLRAAGARLEDRS